MTGSWSENVLLPQVAQASERRAGAASGPGPGAGGGASRLLLVVPECGWSGGVGANCRAQFPLLRLVFDGLLGFESFQIRPHAVSGLPALAVTPALHGGPVVGVQVQNHTSAFQKTTLGVFVLGPVCKVEKLSVTPGSVPSGG